MEFVKMKHSLHVIEEQHIAAKEDSKDHKTTAKRVDQTRRKKSHKLRFNPSVDGSNPMDNNQQIQHKQQIPHPINKRRPGIRKTEGHCWKLEYKPYNKYEVLEKLKQEIYEKNIQRELELEMKSRFGFRFGFRFGEPKRASMMTRVGPDVTAVSYSTKRKVDPMDLREVDYEHKRDSGKGSCTLAPQIKDARVKSSTRIPRNKNRVAVGEMPTSTSWSAHKANKSDGTTFLAHLENRDTKETKTLRNKPHSEEVLEHNGRRNEPNICKDGHASSLAWIDTGCNHHYALDTRVPTNEILEKYFSSNLFPPLYVKSKHEDKDAPDIGGCNSPVNCWTKPEETATQCISEDKSETKKNRTAWKKESDELRTKIKAFIEKPVPEISPSSLLIHRRSTVAEISMSGFSKAGSTIAHATAPERKKSIGVVNIHTCPNVNVFTDRSWMYQDRRAEKCRYIRAPQTPVPPVSEIFHPNED